MFNLTLEERVSIASFAKDKANGRLPVIASGHISEDYKSQVYELKAMADSGIDALVLIASRIAAQGDTDDVFKINTMKLLDNLPPNIQLGLYECPMPYKRLISPELLRWCADTQRFFFLKDTSCNIAMINKNIRAVEGINLKVFNANAATLLESLENGEAGYSGVMANFHPQLYVWLYKMRKKSPETAKLPANYLSVSSIIECRNYPKIAKYYLKQSGLPFQEHVRGNDNELLQAYKSETESMKRLGEYVAEQLL